MDKIIVITGGSSGIGLGLRNKFIAAGDTVIDMSLTDVQEDNHYTLSIDNEEAVKKAFKEVGEKYGRIDLLINCAGFGMSGITELISTDDIKRLTEVNYYGTLYAIRSALSYMNSGSRIVNIASAMALFPVPFRAIYGSVKSAVLTLTFALRMELAPLGIDVMAFCPGDIKTNFTKNRVKNFETNERYGNRLQSATEKSDSREDKRIPCEVCVNRMYRKLKKRKTKPFYIIGGKYKLLYALTKVTPKSWLLSITNKLYGGKK